MARSACNMVSAQLVLNSSMRRWLLASHMLVGPEPRHSDSRSQELLFHKTRPGKGKEWEEVSWIAGRRGARGTL